MNKENVLTIVYWVVFSIAVWAFYASLRSEKYQVEYALVALGVWMLSFAINWYLKRMKKD